MPELPEVETVRKTLELKLKGKKINDINILYSRIFEGQNVDEVKEKIKNQTINELNRKGKWLIFNLDDYYLLSHLRMEGKYLYRKFDEFKEKHELVCFNINDEFELRYKDTRKFGRMQLIKKDDLLINSPLTKLGLEPWDGDLTVEYLKDKYNKKTLPIKTVLLDQTIMTGIGNIYADEILYLSKINPYKKAKELSDKELNSIIINTKKVLEKAIEEGGTTIRSYTSEEGVSGRFQNSLLVHSREKESCYGCGTIIKREKIGGRSTYFCPNCQK